jgi:hypothetical protein
VSDQIVQGREAIQPGDLAREWVIENDQVIGRRKLVDGLELEPGKRPRGPFDRDVGVLFAKSRKGCDQGIDGAAMFPGNSAQYDFSHGSTEGLLVALRRRSPAGRRVALHGLAGLAQDVQIVIEPGVETIGRRR